MIVTVCTWDPGHTLARVEAQRDALRRGVVAAMVKKHGKGDELRNAMAKAKLTSVRRSDEGDDLCAECGALMDNVMSRDGIEDRLEAVRDVAQDFSAAIDRTRTARGRL